jgi:hypothetical protein
MTPRTLTFLAFCAASPAALAQTNVPDLLYFKFNEGAGTTTLNEASPGVGTPNPTLGSAAGFGGGSFGSALTGSGATGGANYVDTGWPMNLNGMSWTIEFWWQTATTSSTLQYMCGSNTSSSAFRIFASGVAANFIVISAPGLTGASIAATPAPGVWNHYAWVYDASVTPNTLTGYKNGAPASSSVQSGTPTLNTGNFIVGGQATQAGLNGLMDEFRLWGSARTAAEIAAAYNVELFDTNRLAVTQSGPGVGDLSISLVDIVPAAIEGWTLISLDTTHPAGSGPLLGIYPDYGTWLLFTGTPVADGNPIHFPVPSTLGGFPTAPYALPPGAVSFLAGTSADFVVMLVDAGFTYAGKSNAVRHTFQ